ncbi:MAG: gluconate 2-dehydrogenase subunit 3 family protein [Spirosomataceae bacterium]
MNRREALRKAAVAAGGLAVLPAWATAWNPKTLGGTGSFLSRQHEALLVLVADTIIPTTDTPGAKDLGVPAFVEKMLADCYEKEVQENVKTGLDTAEKTAKITYSKSLGDCDVQQRKEVLKKMEVSAEQPQKDFFALMKSLTVLGFTTSEYVQTQHLKYNPIPGHYYGCVPIAP